MSVYVFTPEAEIDLFEIWSHIAQDSLESADRVESELLKACRLLAANPYAGHSRLDLTERPMRFWTVPRFARYVIVYDPIPDPLPILRILHGGRNLAAELR